MPGRRALLDKEHGPEEFHGEVEGREPHPEEPYGLADLVPVHLVDGLGILHPGHEHADEGLPLSAAHGIPHEDNTLPPKPLERGAGGEPRHVATARPPPPFEVAGVLPAVGQAVEPLLREGTLGAVVERVGRVGHPVAVEHVARPEVLPDEPGHGLPPPKVPEHVEVERAGERERHGGDAEGEGDSLQRRARGPPPPALRRRRRGHPRAPGQAAAAAPLSDATRAAPASAGAHHLPPAARSPIPRPPSPAKSARLAGAEPRGGHATSAPPWGRAGEVSARVVAVVAVRCLELTRKLCINLTAGGPGHGEGEAVAGSGGG